MLRRSSALLRVSAFSIYLKDLGKAGMLKGKRKPIAESAKMYHGLSEVAKGKLEKRAARMSYPALDAYNRFQKEYAHRFSHLSNKSRQREVARLWAELKEKGSVKVPKDPRSAKTKLTQAAKSGRR